MEVLTHPILDQLAQLGLTGMAQAFAELEASGAGATLTHADWLGLLVDREMTHRRDKRLTAPATLCPIAPPRRRRGYRLPPAAASIGRCSTSSPAANGSMRTTI